MWNRLLDWLFGTWSINWGDGHTETFRGRRVPQTLEHVYRRQGVFQIGLFQPRPKGYSYVTHGISEKDTLVTLAIIEEEQRDDMWIPPALVKIGEQKIRWTWGDGSND